MMPNTNAPGNTATHDDDDLPMTAVKPRGAELLINQLKSELAEARANQAANTAEAPAAGDDEGFKKRYGDLRRYSQQKEATYAKEIGDLRTQIAQLQAAQNAPMPKTREEFEAWKNKYPDIVTYIEIIAEERANAAKESISEELTTVKTKLHQTEEEKAYATLTLLVPDWEELIETTAYKTWRDNQPPFIQEKLNKSDDPREVAYYLNLYKNTLGGPAPKADKRDALATSVRNTGTSPGNANNKWKYTTSQISKMSSAEYEKHEDAITEAQKAGQIYDDLKRGNTVFDI